MSTCIVLACIVVVVRGVEGAEYRLWQTTLPFLPSNLPTYPCHRVSCFGSFRKLVLSISLVWGVPELVHWDVGV